MTINRSETNDLNTQYELNSGIYLVLKEEIEQMGQGYTWADNDNKVQMIIESKNSHEDKSENNTQTTIKWKVLDENNKFESKITMLLYHTNQGVHFQGGQRNGQVTTCSLAADMFETFIMIMIQSKSERIKMIKETILAMNLRRKPFQVASRLMVKCGPEPKTTFKCDLCHYKSTKLTELKRHMYILHRNKTNPDIRKMTEAKKRAGSPPKAERPSKKEAEEMPNPSKTPEQQSPTKFPSVDCLRCDFECEEESSLDNHIKEMHDGRRQELRETIRKMCEPKTVEDSKDQVTETETKVVDVRLKEGTKEEDPNHIAFLNIYEPQNIAKNITIEMVDQAIQTISTEKEKKELEDKNKALNEKVNLMQLKVASLSTDLKHEREALKEVKKEKEDVEKNYQEAARTISEQQRQISIREEQIKVLGELINIDEEAQAQVTTEALNEDGWGEVYEDVTEDGNLMAHLERSSVSIGCKKCGKKIQSQQELREHIKIHKQLQHTVLKCEHCDHTTDDGDELINHVVNTHSPKYTCQTCKSAFSTKPKLLEHIVRAHGFIFEEHTTPDNVLKCHYCSDSFTTKPDLMKHKTEKHYKTRLCPFYHGTGRGCRFPSNVCFNIHEENIIPTVTDITDFRKSINCRNGGSCVFNQRKACFYKHIANNVGRNTSAYVPSSNTPTFAQQTAQNIGTQERCVKCNETFNCKDDLNHHLRTSHREDGRNGGDRDTYEALIRIGQQMESVSQRLQFLELKSMTDFPPLPKGQRRI